MLEIRFKEIKNPATKVLGFLLIVQITPFPIAIGRDSTSTASEGNERRYKYFF